MPDIMIDCNCVQPKSNTHSMDIKDDRFHKFNATQHWGTRNWCRFYILLLLKKFHCSTVAKTFTFKIYCCKNIYSNSMELSQMTLKFGQLDMTSNGCTCMGHYSLARTILWSSRLENRVLVVTILASTLWNALVVVVACLALHVLARIGAALAVPVWIGGWPALPKPVASVFGEAM